MAEFRTDYTTSDDPVPVGTKVWYGGLLDESMSKWKITEHADPEDHPQPPEFPLPTLEEAYVDGVAYHLWPVGVPRKFGNRDQAVYWVRRTSFRLDKEGDDA